MSRARELATTFSPAVLSTEEDGTLTVGADGTTVYATRADMPMLNNTTGDQAYVTENNRLYIWNGSGWYNVALLNVAPSIQSVLDSDSGTTPFLLATDGTPTTITITAQDSDGDPITYAAVTDVGFDGLATISQADNVFTITPSNEASATTTSGTITFTATDGVNIASSDVQTFTLKFGANFNTITSFTLSNQQYVPAPAGLPGTIRGLTLKPDGTRLWITGYSNYVMYQYDLTTPFDITTLSNVATATASLAKDLNFTGGCAWSSDGSRFYYCDTGGSGPLNIRSYAVSTAWDIGSTLSGAHSYSVGVSYRPTTYAWSVQLSDDDQYLCIGRDGANGGVDVYTFGTPNTPGTLTYTARYDTYGWNSASNDHIALFMPPSGTGILNIDYGSLTPRVQLAGLSVAWDLTSTVGSVIEDNAAIASNTGEGPVGVWANEEFTKLFYITQSTPYIYSYDITST